MDEQPDSSQQLMDILLVMDEKGTLQAVSGVKDGELQTCLLYTSDAADEL